MLLPTASNRIEWVYRGIPWECQCIQLDGKIYVLGGGTGYGEACYDKPWYAKADVEKKPEVFKDVYVLDLVGPGRRQWKRCASMQEGRLKFGCGVMGGKIYVFGGATHYGPVQGCEVYDPKADAWSPIRPMKQFRFDHQVVTVGEVFVLYGGEVFDQNYAGGQIRLLDEDGFPVPNDSVRDAMILEAYHPVKDAWREVEPFRKHESEAVFVANDKFYLITQAGIYGQDMHTKSWKALRSNLFPPRYCKVVPEATVVVSDALYVNVSFETIGFRGYRDCLVRGDDLDRSGV